MKSKKIIESFIVIIAIFVACNIAEAKTSSDKSFNTDRDLLLVQFDCKTDVDDLHTAAGLVTLLSDSFYSNINFHAVAGTYGVQDGLYVSPNSLFQLAFGDNWSDAHEDIEKAIKLVKLKVMQTLNDDGDVWIAEAGQSDFTAALVKSIKADYPNLITTKRIHVVQHSNWNEEVTSSEKLEFVKQKTDYHKIPDGNAVGNGTPGFRSPSFSNWKEYLSNQNIAAVWQHAVDLSNKYNGTEGRYNNEAISSGGLDFSDLSEVCYILGIHNIKDTKEFFERFGSK